MEWYYVLQNWLEVVTSSCDATHLDIPRILGIYRLWNLERFFFQCRGIALWVIIEIIKEKLLQKRSILQLSKTFFTQDSGFVDRRNKCGTNRTNINTHTQTVTHTQALFCCIITQNGHNNGPSYVKEMINIIFFHISKNTLLTFLYEIQFHN